MLGFKRLFVMCGPRRREPDLDGQVRRNAQGLNPRGLWLAMAAGCIAIAANASTVSYTEVTPIAGGCSFTGIVGGCKVDSSVPQVFATDVTEFATFGIAMGGMSVTAIFSDGFSETLIWSSTGSGGVADTSGAHRWSLSNTATTFTNPFTLVNSASSANITDIIMSGVGGVNASGQGTVFDRL